MTLARLGIIAVLLAVLVPVGFWLTYGTMDACTAFRQSMAKDAARSDGGLVGAVTGLVVTGAVGIGGLHGRECLEALWKLETSGPGAAMKVVEDKLR